MMKYLPPFLIATPAWIATSASAHIGHLGELAGHDHWVAGAAIGAAAAVTIWGVLKGKKAKATKEKEPKKETA